MDQRARKDYLISGALFFFCVLSSALVFGTNNEERFLSAIDAYKHEQYERALDLNESIPDKGRAVLFNMGNCYWELNKPIDAVVCWRRAQRGAPRAEYDAAQKNIDGAYVEAGV